MLIKVCDKFSDTPGGRKKSEGPLSGELFREEILEKALKEAIQSGDKLVVDLDGGYGYPPSFLDESFGGLARIYGANMVLNNIEIISEDEPSLVDEIIGYIKAAK